MICLKDEYWEPVLGKLQSFLWMGFFNEIYDILAIEKPFANSKLTDLIKAILEGRVRYKNGVFTGTFDVKISKELASFATFSKMAKAWIGVPPPEVISAAIAAEREGQALNQEIARLIPILEVRVTGEITNLQFPIEDTLFELDAQAEEDLRGLAVLPELTFEAAKKLEEDYNHNQQLNIANWTPVQVENLRKVIAQNVTNGYSRSELAALIKNEWAVTWNKARFLARQETSLLVSKFRDQRYQSAGVERYRWMSAHDSRCREATRWGGPAHGPGGPLHGHVFRFDDPPVSGTRGERENPGVPFGCRCVAVPVLG